AGTNSLTIVMGAKSGGKVWLVAPIVTEPKPSRLDEVDLAESQAAVIAATDGVGGTSHYWIRCLPHDFPRLKVKPHPQAGAPTPSAGVNPTANHQLQQLPNGSHLLLSSRLTRGVDLTGLPSNPPGRPNSTIADCVIQELDPHGGLVWKWRGSEHIDPVKENTS